MSEVSNHIKFGELYLVPSRNGLSKPSKIRGEGIKFINMGEIFAYDQFVNTPTDRVPITEKECETSLLEQGDLLFARQSLVLSGAGKCSIFIRDDEDITFESHLIRVRLIKEKAYPLYYHYLFKSPYGRGLIYTITEQGAGQSGIRGSDLSTLKVPLPPLPEQKAIAHILGTLDDKIELNRQMNQTLEAMAQALFKSWFVDFDPVLDNALASNQEIPDELQAMAEKRALVPNSKKLITKSPELAALFPSSFVFNETLGKWIPEGWEVKKLQELVKVKYGKDHKKLEEGDIPCFGSGGIMRYVEKALFENESVLIPRKGTLDNVMYVNKPFWSVDTMFYTEMNQKDFVKYFFYVVNKLNFSEMNEGSAVPSMTTAQLNAMDILLPTSKILSEFEALISKYFSKKEGNNFQSETLTQLRDRLLLELISGRLRVQNFN
ncbi:type I restriction enzyme S subunit [Algoriphagus yeomjeoni]|uniref:Type I restriction enzyme S subunit n=2 Tax=Algoriphagus yeomjeoni TaxID=291403 RepID=A0A327P6N2_9BACT|nr:type I restriction enzyme S subunit [Algoriphagus yeomjeoni]